MKKLMIGMALACLTAVGYAEKEKTIEELNVEIKELLSKAPRGQHGGKKITPEIEALMNQRRGGLVFPKTNGKSVLLVDGTGGGVAGLQQSMRDLKKLCHLPFTIVSKTITDGNIFKIACEMKTAMSPAVLVIVDKPGTPTLTSYPEDAVGVLNVAALKTDDAEKFKQRISKEISRLTGLALGGYVSASPTGVLADGLLSPVFSVEDLDRVNTIYLLPLQYNGVYGTMKKLGIESARPTPYALAVRQGWAPVPTNEIQKAIWDKVHSIPDKPLKIEFDPAARKGKVTK